MKKSCLIAVIATLAAVAGALAAVAVYLHRREKELDEYERLLFGEDKAETVEPAAEQPAEDPSAEDAAEKTKHRKTHPACPCKLWCAFLYAALINQPLIPRSGAASSPARGAKCRDAAL